ncbi:MAG: hypothetical protein E5V59_22870, partial [Mesorhizobium sp.]
RRSPPRVGGEAMRGLPAEILDWQGGEGHVLAQGERWRAPARRPEIGAGQQRQPKRQRGGGTDDDP